MDALTEVLQSRLTKIQTENMISADDVLSLESMIAEVYPDRDNKIITSITPIHKFSLTPTSTNVEVVTTALSKFIAESKSLTEVITKSNTNRLESICCSMGNLLRSIASLKIFMESIEKIPSEVITILSSFSYVIRSGDTFITLKQDAPLLKALLDTDLKTIFFGPSAERHFALKQAYDIATIETDDEHQRSYRIEPNDVTYGLFHSMLKNEYITMEGLMKDYILGRSYTVGHSLTIEEFINIYHNREEISQLVTNYLEDIKQLSSKLLSSTYIRAIIRDDKDSSILPYYNLIKLLKEYGYTYPDDRTSDITFKVMSFYTP